MRTHPRSIMLTACLLLLPLTWAQESSPQGRRFRRGPVPGYYKGQITPHWLGDGRGFWYLNRLAGDERQFIRVRLPEGRRAPAFDHARLAQALSQALGRPVEAGRLPFDRIEFSDDDRVVRFAVDQRVFACDLATYRCRPSDRPLAEPPTASQQSRRRGRPGPGQRSQRTSADGRWVAFVREHNLYVRPADGGEEEAVALTTDGTADFTYGLPQWSPTVPGVLVAYQIQPGDNLEVYRIESSPPGGGRARLHRRPYALPGDRFAQYHLVLFDVATQTQRRPDVDPLELEWARPRLHWMADGRRFAYEKVDRGHQRFRVIEVNAVSGVPRTLIDERSDTFIWTAHTENLGLDRVNWLQKTEQIIYASEQSGWRHLYRIDVNDPAVQHPITQGPWVVRGIERIDEDLRQIWFTACGREPNQDPYFLHHYRVDFDGSHLVRLTEGNGTHEIQWSPDRRVLIDTYSRVDQPPIHTLRRGSDGGLICELERADITELIANGWQAPEVFVAKGRDGVTDIWGIICRPPRFDPNDKIPVIESIYAGPQSAYVPKRFSPYRRFAAYTDLGFIVVQMDAMGTAHRSKAFHDVCWKNLKDAGFPDRILWHRAVARRYPYYDLSRVGIYGTSAGGQNAAAAVLFHPDVYRVAVASCGCHDNRMDKASWNEQWMGYPVGPQYSASSNIDNAWRLQGHLLLIVGEMDDNVPPENTLRFADALIKAGKDFDLVVVPGAGHGGGGSHGERKRRDFFLRHLMGQQIPNHNAPAATDNPRSDS